MSAPSDPKVIINLPPAPTRRATPPADAEPGEYVARRKATPSRNLADGTLLRYEVVNGRGNWAGDFPGHVDAERYARRLNGR
jgi:hypothetical protein